MKKLLKKKAAIYLVTISLIAGSVQVYAATALDTNILGLIKDGYKTIQEYFIQTADIEVKEMEVNSTIDIEKYIDTSVKQSISEIESHKKSELERANKEISSYVNEVKNQLNIVLSDEEDSTKQIITKHIDSGVENIKKDLNKDLENYIKNSIKK